MASKDKDERGSHREDLAAAARRFPQRIADSLAAQTALLLELMDCVDELVLVLDPSLRIMRANRYASLFFGYPERQLVARPLGEFLAEGERERLAELAGRATAMRRAGEAEFVTRARSVARFAFSLSPLRGAEGEGHGFLAVARRLKAEAEADRAGDWDSGGLSERMLRGFEDPLFLIDGRTRTVLDCNAAAISTFGYSRSDFVGRRLFELCSGPGADSGDAIMARADEAYASSGIFQERIRLPRREGSPLPCECIALPFFDRDGCLVRVIVTLFDRSAEEAREAELLGLIRRVTELGDELGRLAASYARHEEAPSLASLGFSPRQVEIARRVAEGSSSKDIGFRLGIAESTVKNHLAVIYRKLGVSSRMGFLREVTEQHIKLK